MPPNRARTEIGEHTPLDDRLDHVLECARTVGFDSLDSLVAHYYTADFCSNVSLSNHQRMSRKRHLPGIVAGLRSSASNWSSWEKEGFQHEILRTAENLLVEELRDSSRNGDLQERLRSTVMEYSCPEDGRGGESSSLQAASMPPVYNTIQNEVSEAIFPLFAKAKEDRQLPNLWAFLTTLIQSNEALNMHEHARIVLASVMLLHVAGRIPHGELIRGLRSCLDADKVHDWGDAS